MRKPCLVAALAVCLMAMASVASAQTCIAGFLDLDLVDVTGTGMATHEIAKCLASVRVNLAANCSVSLTPFSSGSSYVPGIWAGPTTGVTTYKVLRECPVATSTPIARGGSDTDSMAAMQTAFENFVYGAAKPIAATLAFPEDGVVTLTNVDGTLFYAIKQSTITAGQVNTKAVVVVVESFNTAVWQFRTGDVGAACDTGRYGFMVSNFKVCALCPSGTFSDDGYGCTPCAAGKVSGADATVSSPVGAPTCAVSCAAGTYAAGGNSDCLPCPSGTFSSATGASECTECPPDSSAWIPGSTECLRCVNGVPKCAVAGTAAGGCYGDDTESSPGNHIVSVQTSPACANGRKPAIYGQCGTTLTSDIISATTQLSLLVAGDCSISITPISYDACSEEGAAYYAGLRIQAYYQSPTVIRSLLPASDSLAGSSSFLLSLTASGTGDGLTFTTWEATTDAAITPATTACAVAMTPVGGEVADLPSAGPITGCPAGSYSSTMDVVLDPTAILYCMPCPVGHFCAGGTAKVACPANTFNPLLGQKTNAACSTCGAGVTSAEGADACTLDLVDITCASAVDYSTVGREYDAGSQTCVKCQPGTFRADTAAGSCTDCAAGTYSAEGAKDCIDCPVGEFNPSPGASACQTCPIGSRALTTGTAGATTTLLVRSTFCDACPAGTVAPDLASAACAPCDANTYRSGDAAPENNKCIDIPAGYKQKNAGDDRTEINLCPTGQVSFWTGAIRTPDSPTACDPCTGSTIAPRVGMAKCVACKGGFRPNTLTGGTACTPCESGSFRNAFTNVATCATTCPAGNEVSPSSRQACTQCRPGFFSISAGTESCSPCLKNTFSARVGTTLAACTKCPNGHDTQDTGNSACTPCAKGYYTSTGGDLVGCRAAPAGTFVNRTAAVVFTACPVGTFNPEIAQDSCGVCPPGQYANTRGSKSCKTCPAGTFSGAQASTCRACNAGFFSPSGSGACSPCRPGTFASATRSGTCQACARGFQCPTNAMRAPATCPRGFFSNKDGNKLCTPCPVNTASDVNIGAIFSCTACGAGFTTRGLTGQSKCQAVRVQSLRRLMS